MKGKLFVACGTVLVVAVTILALLAGWIADAASVLGLVFSDKVEAWVHVRSTLVFRLGIAAVLVLVVLTAIQRLANRKLRAQIAEVLQEKTSTEVALDSHLAAAAKARAGLKASVYVDLLAKVHFDWTNVIQSVAIPAGPQPTPPTPEENFRLSARCQAFASTTIRDLYDELLREISLLRWLRAVELRRMRPQDGPYLVESETTSGLSRPEVTALKQQQWEKVGRLRERLVDQVRTELGDSLDAASPG